MDQMRSRSTCPDSNGILPECAPLAAPYVPFQQENSRQYGVKEALQQGTLFPGLNLPFFRMPEGAVLPETPLLELQAMGFVLQEMALYLDTHPNDKEAFAMFRTLTQKQKEARSTYTRRYGPISRTDLADAESYNWIDGPWPWEYSFGGER